MQLARYRWMIMSGGAHAIALFIGQMLVLASSCELVRAANAEPTAVLREKPSKSPRGYFKLITSKDDGLCKPLTALYNYLLSNLEKTQLPSRKSHHAMTTAFETKYQHAFQNIGLLPYKQYPLSLHSENTVYSVDLFSDHHARFVVLHNYFFGDNSSNKIEILKQYAHYTESCSASGIVNTCDIPKRNLDAKLTNSVKFSNNSINSLFYYDQKYIFIENHYTGIPLSYSDKGDVRAFTFSRDGRNDICDVALSAK